ncbi:MAG: IPT/TIG domain-containing protein, partial [Anaerolineae bacterium]
SNQPEETTILGNGVDVSILPILSQRGRLDWGVKPYDPGTNGGIAGSVFYDTMRAEDDAAYAGAEPWQPGIPGLEMRLYAPVPCGTTGADCDTATGMYELASDGSYAKGYLLNTTTTEHYVRPKDCVVRDVNGDPINDIPSLPPSTGGYDCLEAPLTGIQFGTEWSALPGNWGFGEVLTNPVTGEALPEPQSIPVGNYLVEVVIPDDPVFGQPLFTPTREEDLNMFTGDTFFPSAPQVAPPICAGPSHIVDVEGVDTDGYALPWAPGEFSTPVHNPDFAAEGGSRFEGQIMPLCNVKLVNVGNQKSIAPLFQLWTPVPIPGRWRGYVIDDLNVTTDPLNLTFGEKLGIAHSPVGIYDFTGRLVHTMHTDYHGVFEVLLPSDATYNAPSPSGMLASVYYIYGNDPGQPGNLNANYNPQYRSIGTSFEVYPGNIMPADLAPTQNGTGIWNPTSQTSELASCALYTTTPQIFTVNKPYISAGEILTITGTGFGSPGRYSRLYLGRTRLSYISWTDRQIVTQVPPNVRPRPWQLSIQNANLESLVNSLTIHVLGAAYNPPLFEVGPGMPYTTIQSAIDAAAGPTGDGNGLVVVYPGMTSTFTNPLGIWFENPIIYSPIMLQGVGPGGVYPDGTGVLGSVLDGRGVGGDTAYVDQWRTTIGDIWLNRGGWDGSPVDGDGNPRIYEGPVVTILANDGEFTNAFPTTIDGFTIQGGDQQGAPANLNQNGEAVPGVPAQVVIQGGGVFVNAYARYTRITNNVIRSNGGAYAAAIRVGTPHIPDPLTDHENDNMTISNNRILANGGTNLAGAIGLFNGAQNYDISYNDICGNFSAEYGGGISHYGYSPGGAIHHNRIYFNRSYDEGGGIMIAGELPVDPDTLSVGAGPVNIYNNLIQANLGNDDGGGLRFLMAGDYPYNVYNNFVANNISTHEGGGISLNDTPDVRIYNNTIVKNLTTATATTSNGQAAPAGLSSSSNSVLLQATLAPGAPTFSDPILFNNIFWDNRAGSWTGGGVAGIGQDGDPNPIYYWDLGVAGTSELLSPRYSLLHNAYAGADGTNVIGSDPLFAESYDVGVRVYPWRGNPAFIGAQIVAVDLPPNLMGDYRLTAGSPAQDIGVATSAGVSAPHTDYDDNFRPVFGFWDAGADESIIQP